MGFFEILVRVSLFSFFLSFFLSFFSFLFFSFLFFNIFSISKEFFQEINLDVSENHWRAT